MPEPPEIEAGRMLALRPEVGEEDSITVPENPLVGATEIVEVPAALVLIGAMAVGFAAIVKSGIGEA